MLSVRLDKNTGQDEVLAELLDFATKSPRRAARIWRDFVGGQIVKKAKNYLGTRGPTEPAFSWGTWQRVGKNRNWTWVPHSLRHTPMTSKTRALHPRTTSVGYGYATMNRPYNTMPLKEDGYMRSVIDLSPVNFKGAGGLGAIFTISVDASYAYKHEYGGTSDSGLSVPARPFMRPAIFWFEHEPAMQEQLKQLLEKQVSYFAKRGDVQR